METHVDIIRKKVLWTVAGLSIAVLVGGFYWLTATVAPTALRQKGDSREALAQQDMHDLIAAVRAYRKEYNKLPVSPTSDATAILTSGPWLTALTGEDSSTNPKQIRFWQPPAPRGQYSKDDENQWGFVKNAKDQWQLLDPWRNAYLLQFDVDGDGRITNPGSGKPDSGPTIIETDIIAYSGGSDWHLTTWKGNLRTWK